ncbi:TetR/AcrR family transcriptional regulator [Amycolatopsis sp. NPDC059657]|uniref:TetR/AcrR family transcriptional regulator n=1 Tax=Amycolatopsis sp. NPDC059657 TaxID=3346899 RepID=UPI00366D1A05
MTPRRAPAERQRDPERTKAKIVEAAKAEFGAKGYAATRVSDIADRAGVNKQLISYYFGGKEGLYNELTASGYRNNSAITDPTTPLADVLRQFVFVGPADRDAARLFVWENLEDSDVGFDAQREFMQRQVDYMRARQAAGDFPDDLDPGFLLLALIATASAPFAFARVARAATGLDPTSPEFTEAYAEQLTRLVKALAKRD